MELEGSTGSGFVKTKRLRIKKGYYKGILKEFKAYKDKEGKDIEAKFGKQAMLLFDVYGADGNQIIVEKEDKTREPLVMLKMTYSHWKNKDGTYSSAITKGSQTTKILKALKWEFAPGKKLNTEDLIGTQCELNIDDYDAKWTTEDGTETTYKASTIKDINIWEEEAPLEKTPGEKAKIEEQKKKLEELKSNGMISEVGYNQAMRQLNN